MTKKFLERRKNKTKTKKRRDKARTRNRKVGIISKYIRTESKKRKKVRTK